MSSCFRPIFGGCHQGPIASTWPVFNPVLGLRLGPAHLLFQIPSYIYKKRCRPSKVKKNGHSITCLTTIIMTFL